MKAALLLILLPCAAMAQIVPSGGGACSPSRACNAASLTATGPVTGGSFFYADGGAVGAGVSTFGNGIQMTDAGTNLIEGATTAANASSTVAALTCAPTNVLDSNDLIFAWKNKATNDGGIVGSVDLEGDMKVATLEATASTANASSVHIATDRYVSFGGTKASPSAWIFRYGAGDSSMRYASDANSHIFVNTSNNTTGVTLLTGKFSSETANGLSMGVTNATNYISSATADATTSSSVPGLGLRCANITSTDLCVAFQDSAGANLLSATEAGIVNVHGLSLAMTNTGANVITSATTDATTSATVASLSLKAAADITATDLILAAQDSAGNNALALTEAGTLTTLAGVVSTAAAMQTFSTTVRPLINFYRGRGTSGSPAAVQSGDLLGDLSFGGYVDSSTVQVGARIAAIAEQNFAGNDVPTQLSFYTVPDATAPGTPAGVERLRIQADGSVQHNPGGGSKPTCDSSHRGSLFYVAGGAGVADTFEACRKDAGDSYAWVSIY